MQTAAFHPSLIVAGPRPSASRWTRFVRPEQLYRQARVAAVERQTEDAVSITLAPMDDKPCDAAAGQYLTLIADVNGARIKRAYSLSQLPDQNAFTVTCKAIAGGRMSGHLNSALKAGDLLQFAGPSGEFLLPDSVPAHYAFVAAGSGITPIMAMLEQLLEIDRCRTPITLLFGNRREKDILFRDRLEQLVSAHANLSVSYYLTRPGKRWKGQQGRISAEALPQQPGTHYFLCGPDTFNSSLREALLNLGISSTAISTEQFTQSSDESRPHPADPHPVQFRLADGSEHEVTVRPGESLLEAGLRGGVPLQFSCTMGGCGHCKVTIETGDVATDEPNCLTESERQAGQTLACCAWPHSKAVVQVAETGL